MNKRDTVLSVVSGATPPSYVPAAFFRHFDPVYHQGQAAIDKHLEYFRHTGMDLLKIQYEQINPAFSVSKPQDWAKVPRCTEEFFEPTRHLVEGLVAAAKKDVLVIETVYSPFMWAMIYVGNDTINAHMRENPDAVNKGLEILTENVLTLLRVCKKAGVDGFYTSTEGGETFRFAGTDIFRKYIKPIDLTVWNEIKSCTFNILHVCDYSGSYSDYTPFLDYPGDVVNLPLKMDKKTLTPKEAAKMFGRPFMGGMERKGPLATGPISEIQKEAKAVLKAAPERFILGADCTVPEANWDNLKAAIEVAHSYQR